ncbi:uncharacterized protein [Pocillopora verrucosa]|uniref:uncharacterized protein n=1 Tax=Pocillopora verrucosa TaxID=203993 RepID=UPI00333F98A1
MADKVCEKLINGRSWVRYTDANKMPHEEGIYVIGVKRRGQKAVIYLYLGLAIDVHVRLTQHKCGDQEIDHFIKRHFRRNGGKDLRVKWIEEPKHKEKETVYIKCVENKLGYKLKYNKIGRGN